MKDVFLICTFELKHLFIKSINKVMFIINRIKLVIEIDEKLVFAYLLLKNPP
jgi:hypothetical protein